MPSMPPARTLTSPESRANTVRVAKLVTFSKGTRALATEIDSILAIPRSLFFLRKQRGALRYNYRIHRAGATRRPGPACAGRDAGRGYRNRFPLGVLWRRGVRLRGARTRVLRPRALGGGGSRNPREAALSADVFSP